MQVIPIEPGSVVRSRAGRDQGRIFLVVGMADGMHALLSDGRTHMVGKPKKKKLKHLQATGRTVAEAARRIGQGESMQDHEIRNWLSNEEG